LRWRVHRGGETMLAGMQLADRFPSAPGPQELLAFVAAADGDLQGALNRWRRAAELDSGNPFVLLQAVRGKILEIGVELDPESHWPAEETRQVRAWIDRALQGNPRSEESMELLALIEANAKEFRIPAVNLLQNAVNRMKDPNPVLLALAVIRWRVKDYATARSIVGVVMEATRARPDTKAMAQMLQKRFAEETPKVAEPPRIATNNATASPPTSERTAAAPLPSPAQPRKVQPDDTLRLPLVRKKQVASTQRAPAVKVWRLGSEPARLMTQEECRKADREYVKATEGDAAARYAVAAAYGLGRGVAFDPDDAISWLKQANESGHGAAVELWQKAGGDPAAALKLLREREKGEMSADELPPLADDIASKIKVATERGENAPAQVAYRSVARYPDAHRKAGISGQGTVRCVIDETGRPRQISLRGFSAQEFGKATESSVRGWRFVPEIKDGKAEATTVEITLTYGDPAPVR
jgi:TonB family protein